MAACLCRECGRYLGFYAGAAPAELANTARCKRAGSWFASRLDGRVWNGQISTRCHGSTSKARNRSSDSVWFLDYTERGGIQCKDSQNAPERDVKLEQSYGAKPVCDWKWVAYLVAILVVVWLRSSHATSTKSDPAANRARQRHPIARQYACVAFRETAAWLRTRSMLTQVYSTKAPD